MAHIPTVNLVNRIVIEEKSHRFVRMCHSKQHLSQNFSAGIGHVRVRLQGVMIIQTAIIGIDPKLCRQSSTPNVAPKPTVLLFRLRDQAIDTLYLIQG